MKNDLCVLCHLIRGHNKAGVVQHATLPIPEEQCPHQIASEWGCVSAPAWVKTWPDQTH